MIENLFALEKPKVEPKTVDSIKEIKFAGPWTTKSDAQLIVLFKFGVDQVRDQLDYDESELKYIPEDFDIRGLRGYTIRNLKKGKIGGTEFHRIRKEMVLGLDGLIEWECEDVYKNKRKFILNNKTGVYMPPFILHTYKTTEDGGLFVLANTLFNPEDPRTHDTYTTEVFRKLQEQYDKWIKSKLI